MHSPTDTELIRSIKSGNISAYRDVIGRYQKPLIAYASRLVGNRQDAEDIVQDTFVAVYRGVERLDESRKLAPYLFTAVYNMSVSFHRKHKKTVPLHDDDGVADDIALYEKVYSEDTATEIHEKMDRLDGKFRVALGLHFFDDLSYEEIGKIMGIPVNTVRTYIFRAKERLRRMYEKNP